MSHETMSARNRGEASKSARAKLRREGLIPANVHGSGPSENLALEYKPWYLLLRKGYDYLTLDLTIADESGATRTETVTIAEVLWNPLMTKIRHVDFRRITQEQVAELRRDEVKHEKAEAIRMIALKKKVQAEADFAEAADDAAAADAAAVKAADEKAAAKPAT